MAERRIQNAGNAWAGGSIRASDAEREQVVTALQQHFVDGRITDEELTERIDYLFKTRTRGALLDVTRDLPSLAPPAASAPERRHPHRRRPPVGVLFLPLLAVLLFLPGLVVVAAGAPVGVWGGPPFPFPPPLLLIFLVWLTVRLAAHRRWR